MRSSVVVQLRVIDSVVTERELTQPGQVVHQLVEEGGAAREWEGQPLANLTHFVQVEDLQLTAGADHIANLLTCLLIMVKPELPIGKS